MPIVLKSGSLNLLEPSGPPQVCNGIALPFYLHYALVLGIIRTAHSEYEEHRLDEAEIRMIVLRFRYYIAQDSNLHGCGWRCISGKWIPSFRNGALSTSSELGMSEKNTS